METQTTKTPPAATVIIQDNRSSAAGIASFILGIISIFFLAPVFATMAIILGIIAIINKQLIWGTLGLLCAFIGVITSPILLGMLGLATLFSNLPSHDNSPKQTYIERPQPMQAVHLETRKAATPSFRGQQQYLIEMKKAGKNIESVMTGCKNKRLNGELNGYEASVNCSNASVITGYQNAGYPYMDLLELLTSKRLETAKKQDRNELTESQAYLILSETGVYIGDVEKKRNRRSGELTQAQRQNGEQLKEAQKTLITAVSQCREKRVSGELKSYLETAQCTNAIIETAYKEANYPYMDLITLLSAKREEISERIDSKEISESQAEYEFKKFIAQIGDKENQRDRGQINISQQ